MEWCFIGTFIDTGGQMEEVRQVDQQEQHGITRESKMDRALADRQTDVGVCVGCGGARVLCWGITVSK